MLDSGKGKAKKESLMGISLLVVFLLLFIVFLTACSPKEKPMDSNQGQLTEVKDENTVYEGKIKEAWDYLLTQGLELSEAVTKAPDGEEVIVTWDDLSQNGQSTILDYFLDKVIQDVSSKNNYAPVNLRKVTFILKDEKTVAEVYFINDKIVGGVTYPKEELSQDQKQYYSLKGETLAQIKHIDYPFWQVGQEVSEPGIYYLNVDQARKDGFERAVQILSLERGRYLVTYQKQQECRVYFVNTEKGLDFYTGISFPEYPQIRVKQLQGDQTAVILPDKILLVDSETFNTLEEVKYPQGEEISFDDLDISKDGQTIAYANKKGLVVCDKKFNNGQVLVESKLGKDPHGQDSEVQRYPLFSPDDSLIMYRYVGYEWLIGTGIIAPDGSAKRYYKADREETTYIQWYDSENIYSNGPAYGNYQDPTLLNINTGEKKKLIENLNREKQIEYFLSRDNRLFYLENEMNQESIMEPVKLGYYDLTQKTWKKLMDGPHIPGFGFYSSTYDSSNNAFGFIVFNNPIWSRPALIAGLE